MKTKDTHCMQRNVQYNVNNIYSMCRIPKKEQKTNRVDYIWDDLLNPSFVTSIPISQEKKKGINIHGK